MPLYEHVFIARQDVSTSQVDAITKEFAELLAENGGKTEKTEYWGLKTLAYRIRKNRKGHYVMMHLDTPHEALAEMERQMRLHDDVLRFMTVRIDAIPEGQSVMLEGKSGRDRRFERERERARRAERQGVDK